MKRTGIHGLTLVELIITVAIIGIIAGAAAGLLSTALQAHAYGSGKSALYQEGSLAMKRMTAGVRNCTYLNAPNGHNTARGYLVFSGAINDDGDYYFGDPLFPRIDEDPFLDRNSDGDQGLKGFDDDGDGLIDEGFGSWDDDEDGLNDEDAVDGIDNDGDGNIDEDSWGHDASGVGSGTVAGLIGIDDDGDGQIDEGHLGDDDEDGILDEDGTNEVLYWVAGNNLVERHHDTSTTLTLSTHASSFTATYEAPDAAHAPRVLLSLTLTDDDGESVTFSEYAYPRNIIQKTGKKVR